MHINEANLWLVDRKKRIQQNSRLKLWLFCYLRSSTYDAVCRFYCFLQKWLIFFVGIPNGCSLFLQGVLKVVALSSSSTDFHRSPQIFGAKSKKAWSFFSTRRVSDDFKKTLFIFKPESVVQKTACSLDDEWVTGNPQFMTGRIELLGFMNVNDGYPLTRKKHSNKLNIVH